MKKIFLGLIGLMGLMGLISCDKIEEGEYTVYDGAAVSWMYSEVDVAPVQRVYVEKYTGPRCSNCPLADATLEAIHNDNVVMVSINHPTGQGTPYPNQPDMRTDGGSAWDQWFGINAIPAAYLNRDRSTQYQGDMGNIVGAINEALSAEPVIALDITATTDEDNVYVSVPIQFVKDYTLPVTLTVALVEDSLCYRQLLPDNSFDDNYVHNHMLRKVVTSFWGSEVMMASKAGEKVMGFMTFEVNSDINMANSHIVAFISDKATRKVLNCASCKITLEEEE